MSSNKCRSGKGLWVVIPAGGVGARAEMAVPKQYALLGNKSVLERTLENVFSYPRVQGVVIPLPGGALPPEIRARIHRASYRLPLLYVEGGDTRQDSVLNGILNVPDDAEFIAIHDACRPFCSRDLFERVYLAAEEWGAAICAVPAVDTLKTFTPDGEGMGYVGKTLDRSKIAAVQTPQIFRAEIIRKAYLCAKKQGFKGSDDSSLVERSGHRVRVIRGEPQNFKITFQEDLCRARTIMKDQASKENAMPFPAWDPRVGFGYDIHPFSAGRKCILGGVEIEHPEGLLGHSDADVVVHSVIDAVLGAFSLGDIGQMFSPDDPKYKDVSSLGLLAEVRDRVKDKGAITHVDVTVIAEKPKIAPHSLAMRANIAGVLGLSERAISIKASTAEGLGSLGRCEGVAVCSVVTAMAKRQK